MRFVVNLKSLANLSWIGCSIAGICSVLGWSYNGGWLLWNQQLEGMTRLLDERSSFWGKQGRSTPFQSILSKGISCFPKQWQFRLLEIRGGEEGGGSKQRRDRQVCSSGGGEKLLSKTNGGSGGRRDLMTSKIEWDRWTGWSWEWGSRAGQYVVHSAIFSLTFT